MASKGKLPGLLGDWKPCHRQNYLLERKIIILERKRGLQYCMLSNIRNTVVQKRKLIICNQQCLIKSWLFHLVIGKSLFPFIQRDAQDLKAPFFDLFTQLLFPGNMFVVFCFVFALRVHLNLFQVLFILINMTSFIYASLF